MSRLAFQVEVVAASKSTSQSVANVLASVKLVHLVIGISVYISYVVAYRLVVYPYFLSPLRSVPGLPFGNPLVGRFRTIVNNEVGIPQREWVKQYGPVVRVVGPIGIESVIFTKPEALYKILVADWLDYPRPAFLRNILGLVTGYGLLTVTGNEHEQMRRAINPAFSIPNLMAQTDMYYDAIDGLVKILRSRIENENEPAKGKVFLMYEWMSKVTLDIICETAFGYKTDSLHNPHNELAEAYELLLNLQSGANIARLAGIISLPGGPRFLTSEWAYRHRHWFSKLAFFAPTATLIDAMHRIKIISGKMLLGKKGRHREREGWICNE